MRRTTILISSFLLAAVASSAGGIGAQGPCAPIPRSAGILNGCDAAPRASVRWDPDGPGPLPEQLVVAGAFRAIADQRASIAMLDEATGSWTPLALCGGAVLALAVDQNGGLLAGGEFASVDGLPIRALARFDGASWTGLGQPLVGGGLSGIAVQTMAVLPNGDLVVGGRFQSIGGVAARSIARFDGSTWHAMGDPSLPWADGTVADLAVLPAGELVAAGTFSQIGGVAVTAIASWNGSTWSPIGPVSTEFTVIYGLELTAGGDIYCHGLLRGLTGNFVDRVARWNGTSWQALAGLSGGILATRLLPSGDLLVAGTTLTIGGVTGQQFARWDGSAWQTFNPAVLNGAPTLLAAFGNGDLLVGGDFTTIATGAPVALPVGRLARFDGATWTAVQPGTQANVLDVLAMPLTAPHLAVGDLQQIGDNLIPEQIARSNSLGWTSAITSPTPSPFAGALQVSRIVQLRDGTFVVMARTSTIFSTLWQWFAPSSAAQPIGNVRNDPRLAVLPGGDLLVAGSTVFVSSSNQTFTPLGRRSVVTGQWTSVDANLAGQITALAVLVDGSIVIGGSELMSGGVSLGHVARWHNGGWDLLQQGLDAAPNDLAATVDGGFVAIGPFTTAGGNSVEGIARFDGAQWQSFGPAFANSPLTELRTVAVLPSGELLVGGRFDSVGGVAAQNVARWDGASWHPIGAGADGRVRRISVAVDGGIVMCGDFVTFDGMPSAYLVQLDPTCVPWTPTYGQGCIHVFGGPPLTLNVDQPPMRGGTVRTSANGLPGQSLALALLGVQTTIAPLFNSGLPVNGSCSLWLLPTFSELLVPSGGRAEFAFDIPSSPAVVGLGMPHQMVSIALDGTGALTSVAVTNAISLVIGSVW